jgi:hypothetical protein
VLSKCFITIYNKGFIDSSTLHTALASTPAAWQPALSTQHATGSDIKMRPLDMKTIFQTIVLYADSGIATPT